MNKTETREPLTDRDIEFFKAIAKAVELRGKDFVYPEDWRTGVKTCVNRYNGEPACIIGLAADLMGVTLPEWGGVYSPTIQGYLGISRPMASIAAWAQSWQDQRGTWGVAYEVMYDKAVANGYQEQLDAAGIGNPNKKE